MNVSVYSPSIACVLCAFAFATDLTYFGRKHGMRAIHITYWIILGLYCVSVLWCFLSVVRVRVAVFCDVISLNAFCDCFFCECFARFCAVLHMFHDLWRKVCFVQYSRDCWRLALEVKGLAPAIRQYTSVLCEWVFCGIFQCFSMFFVCFVCFLESLQNTHKTLAKHRQNITKKRKTPQNTTKHIC